MAKEIIEDSDLPVLSDECQTPAMTSDEIWSKLREKTFKANALGLTCVGYDIPFSSTSRYHKMPRGRGKPEGTQVPP